MTTILIPLGRGSLYHNRELRLCIESIKRFATGFDDIIVAGEDPKLRQLGARFIPIKEINGPKAARIAWKFLRAMQQIEDDDILLWADDYVMLKPFDLRELPYQHIGALRARAGARRGEYPAALLATGIALEQAGYSSFDYDTHHPMRVSKKLFASLAPWWERSLTLPFGLLVKSTYGNVLGIPATHVVDCKVYSLQDLFDKDQWICSLPENCNAVIDHLTRAIPLPLISRFSADPSPAPSAQPHG